MNYNFYPVIGILSGLGIKKIAAERREQCELGEAEFASCGASLSNLKWLPRVSTKVIIRTGKACKKKALVLLS